MGKNCIFLHPEQAVPGAKQQPAPKGRKGKDKGKGKGAGAGVATATVSNVSDSEQLATTLQRPNWFQTHSGPKYEHQDYIGCPSHIQPTCCECLLPGGPRWHLIRCWGCDHTLHADCASTWPDGPQCSHCRENCVEDSQLSNQQGFQHQSE